MGLVVNKISIVCVTFLQNGISYVMFSVILHIDETPSKISTSQIFMNYEKLNVGFCKDDFYIQFSVCEYLCTCNTTTATTIKTKTVTSLIACVYFCYSH